jgi:hypothetical protein
MAWFTSLLSGFVRTSEWREIATAPSDCALDLAIIGEQVGVLDFCGIRHGEVWLEAATLKPIEVAATHWRFHRPSTLPISCCC